MRCVLALLACSLTAPSCAGGLPEFCGPETSDVTAYPADGAVDTPRDVIIRILSLDSLEGAVVSLTSSASGDEVPVELAEVNLDRGVLVEATPLQTLEPGLSYTLDVTGAEGSLWTSTFETGEAMIWPGITDGETVTIEAMSAEERVCCKDGSCSKGTSISLPPLDAAQFRPQLLLVEVARVSQSGCNVQHEVIARLPALYTPLDEGEIVLETDLELSGCFSLTMVDQRGNARTLGEPVCTSGYSFPPEDVEGLCEGSLAGCAASADSSLWPALLLLLFVARWWWRRRLRGSVPRG